MGTTPDEISKLTPEEKRMYGEALVTAVQGFIGNPEETGRVIRKAMDAQCFEQSGEKMSEDNITDFILGFHQK